MNINITAPINFRSFGQVGTNICKALDEQGHQVALWPIGMSEAEPEKHSLLQKLVNNQNYFDYLAPSVRIYHQNRLDQHVGRGKKVGFICFELDAFSAIEQHHLSWQDQVIVCSQWAKSVIEADQYLRSLPVAIVPLGVDPTIFSPTYEDTGAATRFFICGKIEYRKSFDVVIEAFNKAFSPKDNVELHVSWFNPFLGDKVTADWENYYKNSSLGGKVTFHPWFNSQSELCSFMNKMDCGVFVSRSEGWNLPLIETMACAKHVIVTNYSGHTEFANEKNALLVQPTTKETAFDGFWFNGEYGEWMEMGAQQMNEMIEHMKSIHKRKQSGEKLINLEGLKTAQEYSWTNSAQKLVEALS